MGVRYNHTREIDLGSFAPDPDPNVTPPSADQIFSLDHVQFGNNSQHGGSPQAKAHAIYFSLEVPETSGGSISFVTWERDDRAGNSWSCLPGTTTTARKKLVGTGIESATIFVQVTAVSGFGAATKLRIHVTEQRTAEDPGYGADVVMGTVVATQGTSPWIIQEPLEVDQGEPNVDAKAWPVKMEGAGTAAVTDVPASTSPVVLKAANAARLSITIFNDSNRPLTIKCGLGPTATSRTSKVPPQMEWFPDVRYTGVIEGFWPAGATGSAAVTEYTP